MLSGARIPVVIDIAFGDAIRPGIEEIGRRRTEIPRERPEALTRSFAEDAETVAQWRLYTETLDISLPDFSVVTEEIAATLMPAARAALELDTR